MKMYQVYLHNFKTGASSPIDIVETDGEYTARQYIVECEANADPEWIEMIRSGEVSVVEIE